MSVSYVKTPRGEELAILPRSEFEEIVAAAAHNKAVAAYRSGRDPGLSGADMRALLAASSPLAFWRRKRSITQSALAQSTGLAQNYLSDLETGKRTGSATQWRKIARALDLPVDELIPE
jgi:DNA-binding XRE family transcriptional regulator